MGKERSPENFIASNNARAAVIQYGKVSAMQLIVTVLYDSFQIIEALMWYGVIEISYDGLHEFNDVFSVVQVLDCLMLIICIYIGFVKKRQDDPRAVLFAEPHLPLEECQRIERREEME